MFHFAKSNRERIRRVSRGIKREQYTVSQVLNVELSQSHAERIVIHGVCTTYRARTFYIQHLHFNL